MLLLTFSVNGQQDSTFIYNPDGTKDWWYIQKDVMSFRLVNNQQITIPSSFAGIDLQTYWGNDARKMNELHLDSLISTVDLDTLQDYIASQPDFETFAYGVSKYPNTNYNANKFYTADDQIIVVFENPPSYQDLIQFEQTYKLELKHEPFSSLPNPGKHAYIFKYYLRGENLYTSFELSQTIFENEQGFVYSAEPNLYNRHGLLCTVVDEMNTTLSGINGTWHINNDGGIIWNNTNGTDDADADICECWAAGYTGEGIKVGVIDESILEFNHPDLENIISAVNTNLPNGPYVNTNFYNNVSGHSMNVLGVVGATPNNTNLGQRYAVGSAHGADLYAYIGASVNSAEVVIGLQRALNDSVDVLNMSFKLAPTPSLNIEIANHIEDGRPDPNAPNGAWGTVLIASTGNFDGIVSNFPANHKNVIGVGGSNPNDYRASANPPDGENWTMSSLEGSAYGPPSFNYDVVAPMELIVTTDPVIGGLQGSYVVTKGTSISAPIVSSIAAMILEKNPSLTFFEVRNLIRNGAEKVRPSVYDYNMYSTNIGYNDEMFYGRVSCINSINEVVLNADNINNVIDYTLRNMGDGFYELDLPSIEKNSVLKLYSVTGALIMEKSLDLNNTTVSIDLSKDAQGIYLGKILDAKGNLVNFKIYR